jgi:hypothetical protein
LEISPIIIAIVVEASGAAVGRKGLWTVWEERWSRLPLFSVPLSTMNWKCVTRGTQIYQKSTNHFKILGTWRVTCSSFGPENPQILGITVENLSHRSNVAPGIFAHLSPVLITVYQCEVGTHMQLFYKLVKSAVETYPIAFHGVKVLKKSALCEWCSQFKNS